MIPSTDECLASVVRALTDVVMPSLPAEAGLAREQVELSLGHLQIVRAQLDSIASYEAEELADARILGEALNGCEGGPETANASAILSDTFAKRAGAKGPADIRTARIAIHDAIAALVKAVAADGDAATRSRISRLILDHETRRVAKDRAWFAPFGFDSGH